MNVVMRCVLAAGVIAGIGAVAACGSALTSAGAPAAAPAPIISTVQPTPLSTTVPATTTVPRSSAPRTTVPVAKAATTTTPRNSATVTTAHVRYLGGCESPDHTIGYRPSSMFMSCDSSVEFKQAHWSSWTSTEATATGVLSVDDCTPDCAEGHFHPFPASVQLLAPLKTPCGTFFTDARVTFLGKVPSELGVTHVGGHAVWDEQSYGAAHDFCE